MECGELHSAGSNNAALPVEGVKSSTPFTSQYSQDNSPPSPEEKKFLVAEGHTLLGGCPLPAWSDVIHRPAEDSEPDELPSTVDMDAIKGSPSTPKMPYSSNEPWGMGGDRDGSDSSDDESESSDTGSEHDGESGSDVSVSSSCSWTDGDSSSDDDGGSSFSSSSSSSASSCSLTSRASTPQQTFSIRETNFEQGGLKLKIAAMNIKCSDEMSKPTVTFAATRDMVANKICTPVTQTPSTSSTPDKKPPFPNPSMSRLRPRKKEDSAKGVASQRVGPVKRGETTHAAGPSLSSRSERGAGQPEVAISQLAQELSGDALQEINQEDLAAILPDVSTAEGPNDDVAGPPFDEFEDVSSLSGKHDANAATSSNNAISSQPPPGGESSSEDMELLPEQVVTAAIDRIHLDEDTLCTEGADLPRNRDRAESYSSEDGEDEASDVETKTHRARIYSSRLLQQFEQKTALLSQGDSQKSAALNNELPALSSGNKQSKESKSLTKHRRPRGRPPKITVNESEDNGAKNGSIAELDVYIPLDCCNVSNVSPDSGIQSVAGSPVHQSCSPASNIAAPTSPPHSNMPRSTSPVLPATPPSPSQMPSETKKRPGRPAKSQATKRGPGRPRGRKKSVSHEPRLEQSTLETDLPGYMSSSAAVKRGPGRPKKVAVEATAQNGKKPTPVKVEGKSDSKLPLDVASQSSDAFLARQAKKDLRNKNSKTKISKRSKFNIDKRKSRIASKKRWRSNNIKALTVPFHLAKDAALTVAVSQIHHKLSKTKQCEKRKQSGGLRKNHCSESKVRDALKRKSLMSISKHKKLKKKKKKEKASHCPKKETDPEFMKILDEILAAFGKCSISRSLAIPAPGEIRLPSIFRVRKLLKKKKASEKLKGSDRESESEPPKSPHQPAKEKNKRKSKKSAVEPPKRAEPNEQRLPLKKRHYHLSNQQPPAVDSEDTETKASVPSPVNAIASAAKSSQPSAATTQTRNEKTHSGLRNSRNSIEETIEACITRYSAKSAAGNVVSDSEKVTSNKKQKIEDKVDAATIAVQTASLTAPPKRAAAVRSCNQPAEAKETAVKVEKESDAKEPVKKESPKKSSRKKSVKEVKKTSSAKLAENDAVLKKAVAAVKKKAKRRKTINRTGFPIKRKKKPKAMEPPAKKNNSECKNKPSDAEPVKRSSKRKHESTVAETLPLPSTAIGKRLRGCKDDDAASSTTDDASILPISEHMFGNDVPSGDESSGKSGKKKQPPRWRKKYLVAGLFSDYYKEEEAKKASTAGETSKSRSFVYKPEDHVHGLLPPPYHCGKYLRQRRVDFQLPHDLWWLHVNNQLPGRDSVPSWNYKKIRTNVYYDVKPPYNNEAQACNCSPPTKPNLKGCGEDCINRLVYTECSTQLCPCKDRCANQKIQKHEWAPGIEKFMTKDKGWGVRTKKSIKNGEFILEYVGEVVSEKEFKNRMASRYSNDTHHYCLNLDGGLVIDGHRMGGDGRFVNHSCEPNCEMQKWSVNGLFRMALFALRDIEPGEELGYDYNFSLFNPAEGQPCKCGGTNCRGVIGGKSQRITLPIDDKNSGDKKGRSKQNSRKSKIKQKKNAKLGDASLKNQAFAPMRPMSHQQRCFAQVHHCFLLRNLEKVKKVRDRMKQSGQQQETVANANPAKPTKASDVFLAQLNALSTPRSMRTRRLAQAEDNPELTRVARLAYVFKDLYQLVCGAKDEKGEQLAAPFLLLPAKKKVPLYFEKIQEPIDLTMLEKNITSGSYKSVEAFDQDFFRLFNNNVRFYGRTSELGIAAARLRKIYCDGKASFQAQFDDIMGECPLPNATHEKSNSNAIGGKGAAQANKLGDDDEEEIIRCICGLYTDEGLMIQCERCLVWQHTDCVKADSSVEHYHCEHCAPRAVNRDIVMNPQPEYAQHGETHYISLMREELQLRQGDTVYVLRDIVRDDIDDPTLPPQKHTYKTLKNAKPEDCDIFRIERLYTDEKGNRFAFGHHYLRPHETYHEPTRRFFPNEVMRVPLYENVPFDLVLGQCWVLDLPTFCKGRPIGAKEEHVYVCEFRVDKTAHLFARLASKTVKQSVAQLCMKPYAFEVFHSRLKPQRTYTPHATAPAARPRSKTRPHGEDDVCSTKSDASKLPSQTKQAPIRPQQPPGVKRLKQKEKLNNVLLALLDKQQCKQPLDVSYLLEPNKRQRKKPVVS